MARRARLSCSTMLTGSDRHIKTFAKKGDAKAHEAEIKVDVKSGAHVPARNVAG